MTFHQSAVNVVCYVRTSALVEPVDSTVETLREYNRQGVIAGLSVEAWPDEVALTEDTDHPFTAHYELFQSWADDRGVDLSPAFMTRERTTLVNDTPETVIVFPMICLVIHLDQELESVIPHKSALGTYTISDALVDLKDFDRVTAPFSPTLSAAPEADTSPSGGLQADECPVCGDSLLDKEGEYDCRSCSWGNIPIQ